MFSAIGNSPAMTRSTSVRALPDPKLMIFCVASLRKYSRRLLLAARQPDVGEKQRRAARASDAPGELAAPARVEQVVVALRHLIGRHQPGVVGDAEIADAACSSSGRADPGSVPAWPRPAARSRAASAWLRRRARQRRCPRRRSATRLFARISAESLAMISSVSPRQNDIFTNGYFFMKAWANGRCA